MYLDHVGSRLSVFNDRNRNGLARRFISFTTSIPGVSSTLSRQQT